MLVTLGTYLLRVLPPGCLAVVIDYNKCCRSVVRVASKARLQVTEIELGMYNYPKITNDSRNSHWEAGMGAHVSRFTGGPYI